MSKGTPLKDGQKTASEDTTLVMLATIGDTTWRMFVPSIGFTLLGVWADRTWETTPWLMAIGIVIGFTGAFLLVKKQIVGLRSRKEAGK